MNSVINDTMKTQSILQLILMIILFYLAIPPAEAQFFPSGGYQEGVLGSGGNHILIPAEEHSITIPQGWSGISSYLDPVNDNVDILFEPVETSLVILMDMDKVYWPAMNINTIVTWNTQVGYIIKMNNLVVLPFWGLPISNHNVSLNGGWNVIPVLSASSVITSGLLDPLGDTFIIIKEIAGNGLYWPAMLINTLPELNPGKAYQVLVTDDCTITYPPSIRKEFKSNNSSIPVNQPWNEVFPTPVSHTIAINADAMTDLESNDFIGIFNLSGSCAGVYEINDIQTPIGLTAYGDDFTTSLEVEGMTEGELMTFRLYRPAIKQEFIMKVDFSPDLPDAGTFQTNGLSLITGITLESTSIENFIPGIDFSIYPNPSKGDIIIVFRYPVQNADLSVYDMHGQMVRHEKVNVKQQSNHNRFYLGTFSPGLYIVQVKNSEIFDYSKIIITK